MIDGTDLEILNILQQSARTSNAEIARRLEMAPSAILERVRKLEARGILRGYEARLDPEAIGLPLLAFVFVRSDAPTGESDLGERLARVAGVQEIHHIAGEDCFLVKVRTADAKSLGRLLRDGIGGLGSVRTRTTIVLETLRETALLPLPAREPRPATDEAAEIEAEVIHG
jgi:Lrp/AsnC family transcriptional regulator, leucine-responsive regulatory protein